MVLHCDGGLGLRFFQPFKQIGFKLHGHDLEPGALWVELWRFDEGQEQAADAFPQTLEKLRTAPPEE